MKSIGVFIVIIFYSLGIILSLPQFISQNKTGALSPVLSGNFKNSFLADNESSILEKINDTFSCEGRIFGYYADIDNNCQVFHVCVPQARGVTKYTFICPSETVFNQETLVCTWTQNSIRCESSEMFYEVNKNFGLEKKNSTVSNL